LPSVAGKPGLLKETGVAPTRGKTIRIARALVSKCQGLKEAIGSELHTAQANLIRLHGWVSVLNSAKPDTWSDPWSERGWRSSQGVRGNWGSLVSFRKVQRIGRFKRKLKVERGGARWQMNP